MGTIVYFIVLPGFSRNGDDPEKANVYSTAMCEDNQFFH
jgi:hypothetical protein